MSLSDSLVGKGYSVFYLYHGKMDNWLKFLFEGYAKKKKILSLLLVHKIKIEKCHKEQGSGLNVACYLLKRKIYSYLFQELHSNRSVLKHFLTVERSAV